MKKFFAIALIAVAFVAVLSQTDEEECQGNLKQYLELSDSAKTDINQVIISASKNNANVVNATLDYVRGRLDNLDFNKTDLGWLASLYRRGAKQLGPPYVQCIINFVLGRL